MGKGTVGRRIAAGGLAMAMAVTVLALASTGRGDDASQVMRAPSVSQESLAGAGGTALRTDSGTALRTASGAAQKDMAAAGGASTVTGVGADESTSALPATLGQANVVKTASIDVEVRRGAFDTAFSKVSTIAAAHGGFVASSTSSRGSAGDDRQAAGSLVVRVPAATFDDVRRELIALGELRGQQLRGDDVGGQLADLDARLRNLRSQEEAIRLLMTKTTNVGETIEVQRQLGQVREQIELLAGEQARLSDAVAFSTITLALAEPGAALRSSEDRTSIAAAFGQALDGASAVVAAVIVSLGYVLPLGLLVGLAWLVARPVIRLRRAGA